MDQIRIESLLGTVSDALDEIRNECVARQAFAVYGFLRDMSDDFLKKYIDQ